MDLKDIVNNNLKEINIDLDRAGAKKISRDIVAAGLNKMQAEIEAEIVNWAEALKNKLVIRSLEDVLKEFKLVSENQKP